MYSNRFNRNPGKIREKTEKSGIWAEQNLIRFRATKPGLTRIKRVIWNTYHVML